MINQYGVQTEPIGPDEDALAHIPLPAFVAAWETLVGEPPVVMLKNRSAMIRVLVESVPMVPLSADQQADADRAYA